MNSSPDSAASAPASLSLAPLEHVSPPRRRSWLQRFVLTPERPTFWLTRFVILRLLGFVYFFAFLSLARQVLPLIGHDGLLPADSFLERVAQHFGSRGSAFVELPSLFWLGISDTALIALAWLGVGLSLLVFFGFANVPLLTAMWALYMSFVHIGQDWYSYGWEIQLLETGFLAIFLVPLFDPRPFPRLTPPAPVIWLFRWLIFRIMLGAGLIKLRGDPCWRDLSCLIYHYETQPIPGPLSRAFHFLPKPVHQFGVLFNHFAELAAPWFAFAPGLFAYAAGAIMLVLQLVLILSGNLSFLNYLTIVPILACFDDALLCRVLPRILVARAERAAAQSRQSRVHRYVVYCLVGVVGLLSIGPASNLLSPNQRMNTSFDPLCLVNTYGAFGSVGRERDEIIFEGTTDTVITESTVWREYEFPFKPGDVNRRPSIVAPFQPRLDWAIWFAAMASPQQYPWTLHVVWKLLHNDPGMLSLLANDPFPDQPPHFIRARLYRYRFARSDGADEPWWERTVLGAWLPPLSVDDPSFRQFLTAYGWLRESAQESGR